MDIRIAVGTLALVLSLAAAPSVLADDVTDQIGEALKAYQAHDLATATTALQAAETLLRQARAEAWKSFMPAPLPGWQSKDAEVTTIGQAMLGGGSSITREYRQGSQSVRISFTTDSPLLQGLGAFLGSGIMTGSDMKLLVVDGRRATYDRNDNGYTMMVGGKVMVAVKGSRDVGDDTLRTYLTSIKFADMEKASQ